MSSSRSESREEAACRKVGGPDLSPLAVFDDLPPWIPLSARELEAIERYLAEMIKLVLAPSVSKQPDGQKSPAREEETIYATVEQL